MFNEQRLRKQIDRQNKRIERLEEENKKLKEENERLKANEDLVKEKIADFTSINSSLKDAKKQYTDQYQELKKLENDYKLKMEKFMSTVKKNV